MYMPFSSVCDDFYINMRLATQLNLPNNRETVLHFFERVQKRFPEMSRFRKHDNGDLAIEESRENESYRWLTLEARRLVAGHVNPESFEEALRLHSMILEQVPYDLGLSPVEVDYLDILFGFDLSYRGNHDQIIAQSLLHDSPLHCLLDENSDARPVDIQPSITVALSEDCRLQARIDIVTRTNSFQVRTGEYGNEMISVFLVLRRYWGDRPKEPMHELIKDLGRRAEEICIEQVIPKVIAPISAAIAAK